jgi:hypothetical protein
VILEGIVTTIAADGQVNVAPMGPHVPDDAEDPDPLRNFVLKPFRTSQTFRNLVAHGEGVLHVTDDVLLLAQAAVGTPDPFPHLQPAQRVRGQVLRDACRYAEFRVTSWGGNADRATLEVEVLHIGRLREFFGFNRARHAVLEAAILATRTALLPLETIEAEFARLAPLVEKTGGGRERQAFAFLCRFLERVRGGRPAAVGEQG